MKKTLSVILLILLSISICYSQSYEGYVADGTGKPLAGVSVMLMGKGRPRGFFTTTKTGFFSVKVQQGIAIDSLRMSKMGFSPFQIALKDFKNGACYTLEEKAFELKEVKVRPDKAQLRGDTATYLVSAFMQKQDRTIADVLAKIPGIEIKSSGEINVNGKPINKFYIEGMDLLGGKYTLASENLSASKVNKVQVLNNHQPVNALKNVVFSENAALNIVLKDDAKDVWQWLVDLGGGHSLQGNGEWMRDGRIMVMQFARKRQSISMYKTNNVGKDLSHETADLGKDRLLEENGRLSNISIFSPSIKSERYKFNNAHLFATNWLFRLSKATDLRFQFSAMVDKTEQDMLKQTNLLDVGTDGALITESQSAYSKQNMWKGELLYKQNGDKTYISNSLKAFVNFDYSAGQTFLNGSLTQQYVKPRKRYVDDALQFAKTCSTNRLVTIGTRLRYDYLPSTLLLHNGENENVGLHRLRWNTSTSFRHKLAGFMVNWQAGEQYDASRQEVSNFIKTSKDNYQTLCLYLTPSISYKTNTLNVNASSRVSWNYRSLNQTNNQHVAIEPSLELVYKLNAYVSTQFNYLYAWRPASLETVGETAVFTDYITMNEGLGYLASTKSNLLKHSWKYNNPIRGFSAYATFFYNQIGNIPLYCSSYVDGFYTRRATDRNSTSENYSLSGRIAKSLGWGKLSVALSGQMSWSHYGLLCDNIVTSMRQRYSQAGFELSWSPCTWLSAEERSNINFSRQSSGNGAISTSKMQYFHHSLNVFIMPGHWQLEIDNDFYHGDKTVTSRNYFCDVKASYRTKIYEVGLNFTNLFGTTDYERLSINNYFRIYTVNRLRPRAIMLFASVSF